MVNDKRLYRWYPLADARNIIVFLRYCKYLHYRSIVTIIMITIYKFFDSLHPTLTRISVTQIQR